MSSLRVALLVLFAFSLITLAIPGPLREARAQTTTRVYLDPPAVCCIAPSGSITVNVRTDLGSGERINAYDVRLDYTNWSRVLDAQGMDSSGNIFDGQSTVTLANCADGTSLLQGGNGCQTGDSPSGGQIHFSQLLVGATLSGPVTNALLFTITFSVTGSGTSLFTMDRANLLNPGPDQFPNPHYVQAVTQAGVFGNAGIVPFFDFQPIPPPSVLPGQFIPFDASLGFNASSGVMLTDPSYGLTASDYNWNWGDGTQHDTTSGRSASHSFLVAGNYTVTLSVAVPGGSVWSFERTVPVSPNLGALQITAKDANGSPFRTGLQISLYNSSQSIRAFENKTINAVGAVTFTGLSPGTYIAKFSGSSLASGSNIVFCSRLLVGIGCEMLVEAGWTWLETAYLKASVVSPPSIDIASFVYLAVIVGGIAVVASVLLLQRRSQRARAGRKKLRGK